MLVTDALPAGLSVPAGMAAFVSQGDYDPDSGAWSLGDLDAGVEAVMTLPARVEAMPPPCLVNEARIELLKVQFALLGLIIAVVLVRRTAGTVHG